MNLFASSPSSDQPDAALLRAQTHRSRARIAPVLTSALGDCGCCMRALSGRPSGVVIVVELPVFSVADLYIRLLECGLQFDRKGHRELSQLCTLGGHAARKAGLRRNVTLRLELTFLDELQSPVLHIRPALA